LLSILLRNSTRQQRWICCATTVLQCGVIHAQALRGATTTSSAKMRADAAHRSGCDLQPIFATLAHSVTHQQYKRMRCVRAHPHLRLSSAVAMDGAGLSSAQWFLKHHIEYVTGCTDDEKHECIHHWCNPQPKRNKMYFKLDNFIF
jgi:hypothetical protein